MYSHKVSPYHVMTHNKWLSNGFDLTNYDDVKVVQKDLEDGKAVKWDFWKVLVVLELKSLI